MVPSQLSAMCLEHRIASCVTDGAIRLSLRAWHHPKQDVCALKGLSTAELHHESRDWAKTGWERAGGGRAGLGARAGGVLAKNGVGVEICAKVSQNMSGRAAKVRNEISTALKRNSGRGLLLWPVGHCQYGM